MGSDANTVIGPGMKISWRWCVRLFRKEAAEPTGRMREYTCNRFFGTPRAEPSRLRPVPTFLLTGLKMFNPLCYLLIVFFCWLPVFAAAGSITQSIHVEWGYTPPSEPAVTGFKLYQEGVFACQTTDANATAMDCQVTLTAETTNFTLTASFGDGTESPHSAPFAFSLAGQPTTPLVAAITTSAVSGEAPLSVQFNSSSSTGSITSYLWDFGDGETDTTATVTHVYPAAGTYTARLTITDGSSSNQATTTITVSQTTTPPSTATPPRAIVSSSIAAGPTPLAVGFDGSGSTATNAAITSYAWQFGDGATASGAEVTHTYTTAGVYTATLTVTDSNGMDNAVSTPIVVTASSPAANLPPTANATATPPSGPPPLPVNFDASASTDPDGNIVAYKWNFGDGSSATGKTASHTYAAAASYTATLTVTDNRGASQVKSIPITTRTGIAAPVSKPTTAQPLIMVYQLLLLGEDKPKAPAK